MRQRLLTCLLAIGVLCKAEAQNKQLLYDFNEIPQALLLNPGTKAEYQWYAGVPLLSGISLQGRASGISVNDLFANDGLDINDKVRDRAIGGLKARDEFGTTVQAELLSGGFRGREHPENFYSFGIYTLADAITYWPADLAELVWEGNAGQQGRRYRLAHLKTRGDMLNVFHFGINKQLDNRWTVGARAKLYSGMVSFKSSTNSGYFLTEPGTNNLLRSILDANMKLRTSGFEAIRRILDDNTADRAAEIRREMVSRGFFGGDLGLGVDLGFTHNLSNRLVLTASLLDLGFLVYSTDVRTFTLQGRGEIEGVEAIFPEALSNPDREFWQQLVDELEGLVPFEENDRTYLSFRPTQLYASVRYNFGQKNVGGATADCDCDYRNGKSGPAPLPDYRSSVGGQLHLVNRPRGPQAALTAFYQRRFWNALALKATYTADKFSLANLGLGMSLQAGPVEFYLLADNLLGYRNLAASHTQSFQIGLNILSWGRN